MVILNDNSPKDNVPEFSVSELSNAIKRSLEQGFSHVRVRAELGRITIPKSGHVYLDLKDNDAVINGIIWKGVASNLKIKPEEGMEVIAIGKITTYPGQSRYQIIIESLEPAGIGAILLQLEERRKRLAAEGLFAEDRKKPIPFLPNIIGVITSPTGAVIRDILHRISDRFPSHVIVWPVLVQGEKCAEQVVHAIEGFNRLETRPDVLIIARGGGSIEDLWGFNEEIVVRAVASSDIPIISAIGHETDTTLIDYVADLRAPTPTGAAEKAVPVRSELDAFITALDGRLKSSILRKLNGSKLEFTAINNKYPKIENLYSAKQQKLDLIDIKFTPLLSRIYEKALANYNNLNNQLKPNVLLNDIKIKQEKLNNFMERFNGSFSRIIKNEEIQINQKQIRLNGFSERLNNTIKIQVNENIQKLEKQAALLNNLDYHKVLDRGFAIIKDNNGKLISTKESALKNSELKIEFNNGDISVTINKNKPYMEKLL